MLKSTKIPNYHRFDILPKMHEKMKINEKGEAKRSYRP